MSKQSPYVTSTCTPHCASGDVAANSVTATRVDTCDLNAININGVATTQYTTTTLTLAQILDLNNTTVTLVNTQGAGRMIVPGLVEVYLPAGTSFANTGATDWLQFNYGEAVPPNNDFKLTVANLSVHDSAGFFNSTTEQTRRVFAQFTPGNQNTFGIYGTSTIATPVNQPFTVSLTNIGGGVTGGRGGLKIRVYYTVVTALGPF